VTNASSDKDVNVTNKTSGTDGVRVRVYQDLNNNGRWDENETEGMTTIIIEKGESGTVGVPAGMECDVELVTTTSGPASGDWKFV
jgi:hypothetical protein